MWYFAYDQLASWREMIRVYGLLSLRVALPVSRQPAVLRNHRICFPIFSEQVGGGVASIAEAPGKYVAGALFEIPSYVVDRLDEFYGRNIDWSGREQGLYQRVQVKVRRFDSEVDFHATTHQVLAREGDFCPPSANYVGKLVAAACEVGLSSLWIEHLLSFNRRSARSEEVVEELCTSAA